MSFWNRNGSIEQEEAEFDAWLAEVKDPNMADQNLHRLNAEITALRNDILTALQQRYVHPRQSRYLITNIRRQVDTLKGMCFAWLYVTGKWDKVPAIDEVTEEVNDLTMLWLSVDLIKMLDRAYPKKAPRDV